eukprot:SAG31_NODE_661_length_13035_cov_12.057591_16_plen_75_part_00
MQKWISGEGAEIDPAQETMQKWISGEGAEIDPEQETMQKWVGLNEKLSSAAREDAGADVNRGAPFGVDIWSKPS